MQPIPISSKKIRLAHDRDLSLSLGSSRRSTAWRTETLSIADLYWRLSLVRHTAESLAEYRAMDRDQQADAKDVGGFVGGVLSGPRRQALAVAEMHCALLDADQADDDFITAMDLLPWSWAAYTTHSHDPDRGKYRWRAVVPYSRGVTPDEHQAIARRIAKMVGDAYFDPTTFQPHRLFYWPSAPTGGVFEFEHVDRALLDVDSVLGSYGNAADITQWPAMIREQAGISQARGRAGAPSEKKGLVGAFCRCWDIHRAIDEFLPDIYELGANGRYTYLPGTTQGGAVIYDDGAFLYSHHSTDPTAMQLVNAWDLVRIHKFGDRDTDEGLPINRRPSHLAMEAMVQELPEIKRQLVEERLSSAKSDFTDWTAGLALDQHNNLRPTRANLMLLLENDPNLAGRIYIDKFRDCVIGVDPLPWSRDGHSQVFSDADDGGLRTYLEGVWKVAPRDTVLMDALSQVALKHAIHPVREYLNGLTWDQTPRLDTILTHYLGVEETPFSRTVGRKFLVSAVARVMQPGCKADHTLLLCGVERLGKSEFIKTLAGEWHSDSLPHISSGNKDSYEALGGSWIIEIAELSATKKAEVTIVKHFLTKTDDKYREAYGRRVRNHPRQCVFVGTTNENEPLVDTTGNRRFWPVLVRAHRPNAEWIAELVANRDQIWAEAVVRYREGEKLYLDDEMEAIANQIQAEYRPEDPLREVVEEWLERPVPADWEQRDADSRRRYLTEVSLYAGDYTQRQRVSIAEIYVECLGGRLTALDYFTSRRLGSVMRSIPGWEWVRSARDKAYRHGTPNVGFRRVEINLTT